MDELTLLDWKRRVFELYAAVRAEPDPVRAWGHWRGTRDELFRTHPQSPLPPQRRATFRSLDYYEYDPELRTLADVERAPADPQRIAGSARSEFLFRRFALAHFDLHGRTRTLELYWLEAYGGGVFLPFGDATVGETYGGGRYLLDTVKGADLGADGERLVLDFNFAYNPSCAYDPHWPCPLTPTVNRLATAIRGGEQAA